MKEPDNQYGLPADLSLAVDDLQTLVLGLLFAGVPASLVMGKAYDALTFFDNNRRLPVDLDMQQLLENVSADIKHLAAVEQGMSRTTEFDEH